MKSHGSPSSFPSGEYNGGGLSFSRRTQNHDFSVPQPTRGGSGISGPTSGGSAGYVQPYGGNPYDEVMPGNGSRSRSWREQTQAGRSTRPATSIMTPRADGNGSTGFRNPVGADDLTTHGSRRSRPVGPTRSTQTRGGSTPGETAATSYGSRGGHVGRSGFGDMTGTYRPSSLGRSASMCMDEGPQSPMRGGVVVHRKEVYTSRRVEVVVEVPYGK
jgi:hypothetical protein